jgi:hypothetical protein
MRDRFGARDPRSLTLRFHAQTAGSTLTAQQPENNVVRVAVQALAAVLGGCQSLHTNSMDEALALPTEKAVRIALRTQQILAHESGVAATVDPLGGAFAVERLTRQIEEEAAHYLARIDELGGAVTSLLENPATHLLLRDVLVDLPGRDGIRDFLARDGETLKAYESERLDTAVPDLSSQARLARTGQGGSEVRYELTAPVSSGFSYFRFPDPHGGQKVLKAVTRSDGKRIKLENAWLSKSRNRDQASPNYLQWEHWFHLFDADSPGSYTVAFDAPAPVAPLLGEHVVAGGLPVQHLAVPRDAEALGRRAVGLHLRHLGVTLRRTRGPLRHRSRPSWPRSASWWGRSP